MNARTKAAAAGDTPSEGAPAETAPSALDPNHQWPTEGGSYVRQPDGTLTRED